MKEFDVIRIERERMANKSIDVHSIVFERRNDIGLTFLFDSRKIDLKKKKITHPTIVRPHFALTGYTKNFLENAIVIFGKTEMNYLNELDVEQRYERLQKIASFDVPCVFFTKYDESNPIDPKIIDIFVQKGIPVFASKDKTSLFLYRLMDILDDVFSEKASIHGNLVEVFGVGILILGDSGIGKSELTLELLGRGHRFIADDIVILMRKYGYKILGYGNQSTKNWIEIRGAGIFDVTQLFGVSCFKSITEIENVVYLYSRENLEEKVLSFMLRRKEKETQRIGLEKNEELKITDDWRQSLFDEFVNISDDEFVDLEYKVYKRILKFNVDLRFTSGAFPAKILDVPIEINPIEVFLSRDLSVIIEGLASRKIAQKYNLGKENQTFNIQTGTGQFLFPPNYLKED
ncbi:MAG: HPr kinase/phosphorylase [Candidatus Kapaibacterium sp.]|nr:MAG: HPr kinase/phosphorylase [Candidatus Kapabacteria bacterium]